MIGVIFSTPLAAAATLAAAASVPIVIHLLNRRRFRIVDWAAMRFLLAAQKQNVRRLRVEQWLLLATRCGILVLLALALAAVTPWAESWWQRLLPGGGIAAPVVTGRTHKVVILDASLSMAQRGEQGSAFDRARTMAADLVRSSAGGDGFSVIALVQSPQAVVPGPADDAAKVMDEIESMRVTHGTANLAAALHLAEELIRRSPGKFAQREIYVLSDLQRLTWPTPTSPSGNWTEPWMRLHAQAQIVVLDTATDGVPNLAVTDLTIADRLLVTGVRTTITATVHNFSPRARKALRVELLSGRETAMPAIVQMETVDVPASGTATVTFRLQFAVPGDHLVQIRLPEDALAPDNVRSMVLSVRENLPVLLVEGKPGVPRREQSASWLADALSPFQDRVRRPQFPAVPKTIDLAQLADPVSGDLTPYDAVFLCDVARLTDRAAGRLETFLHQGGGVVISLGPNVDFENYNRLLANVLPGRLMGNVRAPGDGFFAIQASEDAMKHPPLAAFAADNDRAALLSARFRQYVRLEPVAAGGSRSLLSFVPPAGFDGEAKGQILRDPLVLERALHRGRVVLVASTLNADWTSWPIAPSFPPFVQELLRFVARPGPRRTLQVGETLDEMLATVAAKATVTTPDNERAAVTVTPGPHASRWSFDGVNRAGLYRLSLEGAGKDQIFAVNVPPGVESDLQRISNVELQSLTPDEDVQIVSRLDAVSRHPKRTEQTHVTEEHEAPAATRGPGLSRILVAIMLAFLIVEGLLAWRFGSARSGNAGGALSNRSALDRWISLAGDVAAGVVLFAAVGIGVVLVHAAWTRDFLGFLPTPWRSGIESALGVPATTAAEGTRWRIEFSPLFGGNPQNDRWIVGIVGLLCMAFAVWLYRREIPRSRRTIGALPALLIMRIALFGLALSVLLPQVRLLFEREGWPDLVVMIDDSQSMSHRDDEKSKTWRLASVQALLTKDDGAWLQSLVGGRQANVHLFRCSDRAERIAELESTKDQSVAMDAIRALQPDRAQSRIGTGVESVLQEFRGSDLAGIIVFTDGVITEGDDLVAAARVAARAGVPLYPIGVGESQEPRDLVLHDLQVEDSVHVMDRLLFEARLTARGGLSTLTVPIALRELQNGEWKTIKQDVVRLDPAGKPVRVRIAHAPTQPGERRYALEAPVQSDERDATNNRLERTVFVAEAQRTRVLYVEGYARYEYRFLKSMLERESQAIRGNKSIELSVLLADADPDHAKQDRSAIDALPASREDLFRQFDLVILGDVDPNHPKLGEKHLQWLSDFVTEKGGGLLALAGAQFMPGAYRDSPLASVLPIDLSAPSDNGDVAAPGSYRLRLTSIGQMHPLFRLATDEAHNQAIWDRMQPMHWAAQTRRPKPAAEILAIRPAEAGSAASPIALQQFVGAGRVLYFGFDESWRWRRREDERLYNQIWLQTVRFLARSRLGRCDLRLDRQTPYRSGEPIRVTARFPDDSPPPAADATVQVAVESIGMGGDRESQLLSLSKIEGSRATYEAVVVRTVAGSYQFRLSSPPSPGPAPEAAARVLPPPGELDNVRLNRADLEQAALLSRGKYNPLSSAERLPAELPELPRVALHQPRPPYPLWSHPSWFAVGLSLIGCEWLLRKRRHLL